MILQTSDNPLESEIIRTLTIEGGITEEEYCEITRKPIKLVEFDK